jgi:hypothetical protein
LEGLIAAAFSISMTAVIIGGAIWFVKAQRKKFAAAFANDQDFDVVPSAWQSAIRTKRAPIVTVTAAGGGKNNPTRWDAMSLAPKVGRRTSLHLSREGLAGKLRELVGLRDVRTGDSEFDERFTVRGAEPDAVRGILANDDVRAAIHALFNVPAWSIDVRGESGLVHVRCPRSGMNVEQARQVGRAARRVVAALEQHADDPPIRESIASAVGGSATGAPVGVPLGHR